MGYGSVGSYLMIVGDKVPSVPLNVQISTFSAKSLELQYSAPSDNGGDPINKFSVEYYYNMGLSNE
jgi:hypothetical protein